MTAKHKVGLDDYLLAHTVEELKALPREPIEIEPNPQVFIEELWPESDATQIEHVLKLATKLSSPLEIERAIKAIQQRTGFRLSLLRDMAEGFQAAAGNFKTKAQPIEISESEKQETLELLRSPTLLQQFLADTERLGCVGQKDEKIALKLGATSGRLSENPINITIKGESATGKNFLMNSVTDTEPPEDVISVTRMSAKALQYMPQSLRHKIVAIAEVMGAEEADYSIRTFQSEKVIKILVVEKNTDGRLETVDHVVEGPAVFFQTTTKTHLHPENETREFDLFVDESVDQTQRIFSAQRASYIDPMPTGVRDQILRRWRNAARTLTAFPVLIPFAQSLDFPTKPLRVRRDHPRVLALIEASALLHQHQRKTEERNGVRFVVAAIEDYAIARELAINLLETTLSGATPKCRMLVNWAEGRAQQDEKFSKKDIDEAMGWSRKTTLKYLGESVGLGCIGMDKDKLERSKEFWFVKKQEGPLLKLPKPEDLIEQKAEMVP
jgi:hypothetical protein